MNEVHRPQPEEPATSAPLLDHETMRKQDAKAAIEGSLGSLESRMVNPARLATSDELARLREERDRPLSVESTLPSADQRNAEKPWWCPICNYAVPRGHGGDHAPEHGRAAERFTAVLDARDRLLGRVEELCEVAEVASEYVKLYEPQLLEDSGSYALRAAVASYEAARATDNPQGGDHAS